MYSLHVISFKCFATVRWQMFKFNVMILHNFAVFFIQTGNITSCLRQGSVLNCLDIGVGIDTDMNELL